MNHYYYIKLYNEILDDPKMGRLSDKAFRLCINLFLLANRQDERDGRLPDFEDIAWMLRLSMDEFQPLWDELERANIVEVTEALPFVTHFEKRQEKQTDAEKQKRYRQRKREQPLPVSLPDSDQPVTNGVTNGNTDIEEDKNRKEKEVEVEKKTPQPPAGYADLIWNGVKEFFSNDEPKARNVMQAQAAFSDITGIKQPYVNGNSGTYREAEKNWWEPLGRMMTDCDNDLSTFRDCITQVMAIADAADGFTVASPRSTVKTFGGILAKRSRVVDTAVVVAGDETPAQRIARLFPNEVNNEMA